MSFTTQDLPALNATLNSISMIFVLAGWCQIRRGNRRAHAICMITAVVAVSIFLISYLIHKYFNGTTRFTHPDWAKPLYLFILFTHLVLAMVLLPLVVKTVYHASRHQWARHKRIARWTLPIWLYVSVTGILVYFFLHQWFPQ